MTPIVPKLPLDAKDAVRSLARAAFTFRGVFIELAEGRPVDEVLDERNEVLELANEVVSAWLAALGVDPESGDDIRQRRSKNGRRQ
jgi:hypothetical protein